MKKKETRTDIFCSALLWLLSLTVFLPLLMIVFTSFKDKKEGATLNLVLPAKWMWENYVQVLKTGNVLRALGNSVFVSAVTLVIVLITASMLGYMIARLNTRGSRFVDWLVGLGIIVPFSAMPTSSKSYSILRSFLFFGGCVKLPPSPLQAVFQLSFTCDTALRRQSSSRGTSAPAA